MKEANSRTVAETGQPPTVELAGAPVVLHYGDPAGEYEAVRSRVGVARRTDIARFRLWGRDPVRMVQGLITNDLAGAPSGQGVYAAMLTPKGRTIAELRAFRIDTPAGTEVWLDMPREARASATEHFRRYVPPMFARWEEVSDAQGTLGVYGPRSREWLEHTLGAAVPELAEDAFVHAEFNDQPVLIVGAPASGGGAGFDVLAATPLLDELWTILLDGDSGPPAQPVGFGALETIRVEAGRPRYGTELTEEIIPTEAFEPTGLMPRAVSFHKGCYTGQEVIVRIAHRGHVNRLLRGLRLGGAELPTQGTPLFHPDTGKQIGWTTTAVASPRLRQNVALGYVRREISPGGAVRVGSTGGPEATVTTLPDWQTEEKS